MKVSTLTSMQVAPLIHGELSHAVQFPGNIRTNDDSNERIQHPPKSRVKVNLSVWLYRKNSLFTYQQCYVPGLQPSVLIYHLCLVDFEWKHFGQKQFLQEHPLGSPDLWRKEMLVNLSAHSLSNSKEFWLPPKYIKNCKWWHNFFHQNKEAVCYVVSTTTTKLGVCIDNL